MDDSGLRGGGRTWTGALAFLTARLGRPLGALGLFVLVSVATRWLSFVVGVLDLDESAHIVGSWELQRGRVLYAEFVDNKPPLLYAYFWLAQAVFGRGLIAVHVFTAVVTIPLAALGVARFFEQPRLGLVAALLFLAYSAAFLAHDMLASNAEIPMIAIAVWALVVVRREAFALSLPRAWAAGALIGIATLVKFQAAAWLGALAVAVAFAAARRAAWRRLPAAALALGGGFAAPLAAAWCWFRWLGADDDLVYWTLVSNLAYARNPIAPGEALQRAASYLLPFLVVTLPLWWGLVRTIRAWRDPYAAVLLGAVVAATSVAVTLGFRFFPHYFVQLYPPLAIGAAPWVRDLLEQGPRGSRRVVLAWTAAMVAGFAVANALLYRPGAGVYRERDPVYQRVAARMAGDRCAPGASLFVWGYAPMVYYYAGLQPASRFVVLAQSGLTGYIPGNAGHLRDVSRARRPLAPDHWNWLLSDLERRRATYVVDTAPAALYQWHLFPMSAYPALDRYVRDRFEPLADVDGVLIYRRKGCRG
jgi:hypothetical protein